MADEKKRPIEGVMETSMSKIKEMIDSSTVIGERIACPDGTTILPVYKVGLGFASGGSDFSTKAHMPPNNPDNSNLCFAGGSGAGVTITPIAFLVVSPKSGVSLLNIDTPSYSSFDKLIDAAPGLIEKAKEFFGKKKEEPQDDASVEIPEEAEEKEEEK